eukprot:SM000028S10104  [mRNA]  locus=s28:472197:473824:+ [translate_table: standard]
MAALSAASLVAAPAAASSFLSGNQKTLRVRQVKPQVGPLRTFVPIRAEVRTGSDPGGIGDKLKNAAEKVAETVDDATSGLKDALSDARGTIRDEGTGKPRNQITAALGDAAKAAIIGKATQEIRKRIGAEVGGAAMSEVVKRASGAIGNRLKSEVGGTSGAVVDRLKSEVGDAIMSVINSEATGKISDRVSGGKGEVREVTIGSKEKDPSSLAANLAQQVQGAVESVTDKLTGAENATRGFDDPNQKGAFTTPNREAKKQAWGDKQAP